MQKAFTVSVMLHTVAVARSYMARFPTLMHLELLKSFATYWKAFLIQQQEYKSFTSFPQPFPATRQKPPVRQQTSSVVSATFSPALHQNMAEEAEVTQQVASSKGHRTHVSLLAVSWLGLCCLQNALIGEVPQCCNFQLALPSARQEQHIQAAV